MACHVPTVEKHCLCFDITEPSLNIQEKKNFYDFIDYFLKFLNIT